MYVRKREYVCSNMRENLHVRACKGACLVHVCVSVYVCERESAYYMCSNFRKLNEKSLLKKLVYKLRRA